MFDNIGGKIKKLAVIVAWIGIICSIIVGVRIILNAVLSLRWGVVKGLLYAAIGATSSWIGSFLLYGFGTLIENSDKTVNLLERTENCTNLMPEAYKREPIRDEAETLKEPYVNEAKRAFFERKNPNIRVMCPHCKAMQKGDNDCCTCCGATFVYRKMS